MAAVLLRQRVVKTWVRLPRSLHPQLKDSLLQVLASDPEPAVRVATAGVVRSVDGLATRSLAKTSPHSTSLSLSLSHSLLQTPPVSLHSLSFQPSSGQSSLPSSTTAASRQILPSAVCPVPPPPLQFSPLTSPPPLHSHIQNLASSC